MAEVECTERMMCDYREAHDHGFACGPYCPCGLGVMAGQWAQFEAALSNPEPDDSGRDPEPHDSGSER